MKTIIVCDSGLGGLNVASRFFCFDAAGEAAKILYFNAYPSAGKGFNAIKDPRGQEKLLQNALLAMTRFTPDLCLIACNTLSVVYERLAKYYTPSFPVVGILDAATDMMARALREDPAAHLLILGTKTTVQSGVYTQRLADKGVDLSKVDALAVPGLATLLESGGKTPQVAARIAQCANEAKRILPETKKLYLGLCCTHFSFAAPVWKEEFTRCFDKEIALLDPDETFGGNFIGKSFQYVSRIPFFPGGKEAMTKFFAPCASAIASALDGATPDPGLFQVPESFFEK